MSTPKIQVLSGHLRSLMFPIQRVAYSSEMTIPANLYTEIAVLEGDMTVAIGPGEENVHNEWTFVISQGDTAYNVTLPDINWTLGIAPAFTANTVTEVRLHYKGDILEGVWN